MITKMKVINLLRPLLRSIFFFLFSTFYFLTAITPNSSAQETTVKNTLDNGLTVLTSILPSSPVVSVYALVKTGSATEGTYLGTGISHFLEHMLFKSTDHRAVGEIASQIQAVGGSINASTGKDYTIYTITVPLEALDKAIEILSDMISHTKIDDQETDKERAVIFNEMRLHNDDPDTRLSDLMYAQVYIKHPYHHPIIGYPDLLSKVSADDLRQYYKIHYAPNNTIISIAGNVKVDQVMAKIQQHLGPYERQVETLRDLPLEPFQQRQKYVETEYPTDLTRIVIAYKSVSISDQDLYALDVLANILGQGESSRLYQHVLKERSLVYSINAYNYTPIDRGIFGIEATLDWAHLDSTKQAISKDIECIKKKGVSLKELNKAKKQVESDYIFGNQTTSSVAYSRAVDEAFTGDFNFSLNYIEEIKKVTTDDIIRAAKKYLNDSNQTTVVLKPQHTSTSSVTQKMDYVSGDIEKYVLNNGLTVLLKRNTYFPLVSIQLALKAGLREEIEEMNGVSKITSMLWLKGTKSKTSQEISTLTETLGMNLNSFSGKNSMGLSLDCLSEDVLTAVNVLEDVVKNPIFPDSEIAQAKSLMAADLKKRDDDVGRYTGKMMRELLFQTHPYRLDEGGSAESLANINREHIAGFYQKYVQPSNLVLSIIGDFDSAQMLDVLKKKFESIPDHKVTFGDFTEDGIIHPREKSVAMKKEQAMVMLGFHAPNLFSQDRFGVEVLTNILGSSFSGRLFSKIREELGKAYTLGGNYVPGIDAGFVYFYVLTTNQNVEKVVSLLKSEIQKIQSEPISDQELHDIQHYLKGNYKDDLQTNAALNFVVSLDELYGLGFNEYQHYAQHIDAVSSEDVKRLAQTYLDLSKSVVVITQSEKTAP